MNSYNLPKTSFLILFIFLTQLSFGTTIVPHPNLGEMAKASPLVVVAKAMTTYEVNVNGGIRHRTEFQLIDLINGGMNDYFEVQNMYFKNDDYVRTVDGDVSYLDGETYLLFLTPLPKGIYCNQMLSYGVCQLFKEGQDLLFVPVPAGLNLYKYVRPDGQKVEPLQVYFMDKLVQHLKDVIAGVAVWDINLVTAPFAPTDFFGADKSAPDHCTYVGDPQPWPRWQNLENVPLPVYYPSASDPDCPNIKGRIQGVINNMNDKYDYINLTDGGAITFIPSDCAGGSAGSEFTTWVDNNLGTNRVLILQINDPCNEIPDLSNCSGVLAIGGLYWFSSTHIHDGMEWNNGAYGYVTTNNDASACLCNMGNSLERLLTHEMTHALGIGHIDPAYGDANMNPSCCKAISALDQACLDYTYNSALVLPVEWTSFTGEAKDNKIQLKWSIASSVDNDYFLIERSLDGRSFSDVGKIAGIGNGDQPTAYQYDDIEPVIGNNFYRLAQYDFDGHFERSHVIAVNFEPLNGQFTIFPNPTSKGSFDLKIASSQAQEFNIKIINPNGQLMDSFVKFPDKGMSNYSFSTAHLNPGMYWVKVSSNGLSWTKKLLIM